MFAQWADSTLFWTAMAYNMQPKGVAALFAKLPPEAGAAFAEDRKAMSVNMTRLRTQDAAPAYRSYLRRIAHMVEEHDFLFGMEPCVADFATYHPLWFTRVCTPSVADVFDHVPAVLEWMDRIAALGHGRMERFTAQDAITVAAGAEPLPHMSDVFQDEHGIALGSEVTVAPESFRPRGHARHAGGRHPHALHPAPRRPACRHCQCAFPPHWLRTESDIPLSGCAASPFSRLRRERGTLLSAAALARRSLVWTAPVSSTTP